ncbi:MAG TPA: hypothetical protein PLP12_13145 [Verrucomicrobiota bacterium]|nr:hypothetical protein [Verrucomicrobiota bacterium]
MSSTGWRQDRGCQTRSDTQRLGSFAERQERQLIELREVMAGLLTAPGGH